MVESFPIVEWSFIWMPFEYWTKFSPVFRLPFEYWTSIQMAVWTPDYHLNTGQVKFCYSDVSLIQTFFIQIPTVLWSCKYERFRHSNDENVNMTIDQNLLKWISRYLNYFSEFKTSFLFRQKSSKLIDDKRNKESIHITNMVAQCTCNLGHITTFLF